MCNIAIVLPCHNEEYRLQTDDIIHAYEAHENYSFIFVDDGSSDHTKSVLAELSRNRGDRISVLTVFRNRGKAEAVRRGVLEAVDAGRYQYVAYLDADFATPLHQVGLLIDAITSRDSYILAAGSRVKRLGADIHRRPIRHILGRIFATAASLVLDLPVYDTQCGAKLFRADFAARIFKRPFLSRWIFDVELFARIIALYGREGAQKSIIEVPLQSWQDVSGSKLSLRALFVLPIDLFRIWLFVNRNRTP